MLAVPLSIHSALLFASISAGKKMVKNSSIRNDKYRSKLSSMRSMISGHVTAAQTFERENFERRLSGIARVNTEDAS